MFVATGLNCFGLLMSPAAALTQTERQTHNETQIDADKHRLAQIVRAYVRVCTSMSVRLCPYVRIHASAAAIRCPYNCVFMPAFVRLCQYVCVRTSVSVCRARSFLSVRLCPYLCVRMFASERLCT